MNESGVSNVAGRAAGPTRSLKLLPSVFIVTHVFMMAVYSSSPSTVRNALVPYFEHYMLWFGLASGRWDMFSPNPLSSNMHLEAEITFRDGSKTTWTFPRMERLGLFERYQKERYRRWSERVRDDAYKQARPDTARYIARLHATPANPPRTVTLSLHGLDIPPPAPGDAQPIPGHYEHMNHSTFFTYRVTPEDLR